MTRSGLCPARANALRWLTFGALGLGLALSSACSEDRPGPPSSDSSGGNRTDAGSDSGTDAAAGGTGNAGSGGTSDGGTFDSGAGGIPDRPGETDAGTITGELGNVPVIQVPDTECVPRGGSSVELYPGDPGAPVFGQLGKVGERRFASGGIVPGFVVFGADGSEASMVITSAEDQQAFASEGMQLAEAGLTGSTIFYQRYDALGSAVGGAVELTSNASRAPYVGAGEGQSLIAWTESTALKARGIDSDGQAAGAAFEIASIATPDSVKASILRRQDGFAVIWSERVSAFQYRTRFALATSTELEGPPIDVIEDAPEHELVQAIKTPSGYAVLISGGPLDYAPYILVLDEAGERTMPAARLMGSFMGYGLAAQGEELGVVAPLDSEEPGFRAFDAALKPLGPWVCLDAKTDINDPIGIDSDGAGYAVVYRRETEAGGAEIYARFDRLGTGAL